MSKVILYLCLISLTVDSYYCWITDINMKMVSQSLIGDSGNRPNDEVDNELADGDSKINLIFPGTKWCGAGNIADNYDDLGAEKETDMCCREHDFCPDIIAGGETKYNLTNTAFYTRLNCSCDYKFLECLEAAKTSTSKSIGVIYFNTLQTKCFREDYPVNECVKRGGWFNTKCLEYSYDTNGDKIYQWFDLPDFWSWQNTLDDNIK